MKLNRTTVNGLIQAHFPRATNPFLFFHHVYDPQEWGIDIVHPTTGLVCAWLSMDIYIKAEKDGWFR